MFNLFIVRFLIFFVICFVLSWLVGGPSTTGTCFLFSVLLGLLLATMTKPTNGKLKIGKL